MAGTGQDHKKATGRSHDARFTHSLLDRLDYISQPLRYEVDANGRETGVILPLDEFKHLLRNYDLALKGFYSTIAQVDELTQNQPSLSLEELFHTLQAEGGLPTDMEWIEGRPVRTGGGA